MHSMTGFGRASAEVAGVGVTVEINAVNQRGLHTSFSLPREWAALERPLATLIRGQVQRGKVHVSLSVDAATTDALAWDEAAFATAYEKLGKLAYTQGVQWPPSSDAWMRLILAHKVDGALPDVEAAETSAEAVVRAALEAFNQMRATEGAALKDDLAARIDALEVLHRQMVAAAADMATRYRELLLQRLAAAGLELEISDERVLREVAIFADRCDVSEELIRLASHFAQFRTTLELPAADARGRKLEFLAQELHREVNTTGSKSQSPELSRLVLDAKTEVERIKEQVANVE